MKKFIGNIMGRSETLKRTVADLDYWHEDGIPKNAILYTEAQVALRLPHRYPRLFVESEDDPKCLGHSIDNWYRALLLLRAFIARRKENMIPNLAYPTLPYLNPPDPTLR